MRKRMITTDSQMTVFHSSLFYKNRLSPDNHNRPTNVLNGPVYPAVVIFHEKYPLYTPRIIRSNFPIILYLEKPVVSLIGRICVYHFSFIVFISFVFFRPINVQIMSLKVIHWTSICVTFLHPEDNLRLSSIQF